jgi:hypothetical protein
MPTNESADTTTKSDPRCVPVLSPRIAGAVEFAVRAHGDQIRKGTSIPYAKHFTGERAQVLIEDTGAY